MQMSVLKIHDLADKLSFKNYADNIGPLIITFSKPDHYTCEPEPGSWCNHRVRYEYRNLKWDLYDDDRNPLVREQIKATQPCNRSTFVVFEGDAIYYDEKNKRLVIEIVYPFKISPVTIDAYCVHFNYSYYIRKKVEWTPDPYMLNVLHREMLNLLFPPDYLKKQKKQNDATGLVKK